MLKWTTWIICVIVVVSSRKIPKREALMYTYANDVPTKAQIRIDELADIEHECMDPAECDQTALECAEMAKELEDTYNSLRGPI